jgi:hypothetical protein
MGEAGEFEFVQLFAQGGTAGRRDDPGRIRCDEFHVLRAGLFDDLGQDEDDAYAELIESPCEPIASGAETAADIRGKLPPEHQYFHLAVFSGSDASQQRKN